MSEMAEHVTAATSATREVLASAADLDWGVPAGDVAWSCRDTAAHIADDLFSYASQVIARPMDRYLPIAVRMEEGAAPRDILEAVVMCGELLRLAVVAASPDSRAGHPNGVSDPDGFAAMGVLEVVVHTYDIATGLGLAWTPPAQLSAAVLERLFPGAPEGDPVDVLLWAAGRRALDDRPRLSEWRWDSSVRADDPDRPRRPG